MEGDHRRGEAADGARSRPPEQDAPPLPLRCAQATATRRSRACWNATRGDATWLRPAVGREHDGPDQVPSNRDGDDPEEWPHAEFMSLMTEGIVNVELL